MILNALLLVAAMAMSFLAALALSYAALVFVFSAMVRRRRAGLKLSALETGRHVEPPQRQKMVLFQR